MKTILVPTDFSDISLNAVNYAADMAGVLGIHLTLLHVCPETFLTPPAFYPEEMISIAERSLKQLKANILKRDVKKIRVKIEVYTGDVVSCIKEYCETYETYAVVMGTESRPVSDNFLFGGSTVDALKELSCPLIVVPSDVKFGRLHKIGLACDFKDVSETVPVVEIRNLVKEFNSELHILHIHTRNSMISEVEIAAGTRWIHDQLGSLNPKYHFINSGITEKSIIDFADKIKLDMLILIPHDHSVLDKILNHSRSRQIVLHAHVPVLSIHE